MPTAKVIDEVRARWPELKMVSFKYQEQMAHDQLIAIARERLARGHTAVVANRGEETGPAGEQVAYIVMPGVEPRRLVGKPEIAVGVVELLETLV